MRMHRADKDVKLLRGETPFVIKNRKDVRVLNEQPLCLCQLHLWQRTSWSVTIAKQVLQQPLHPGNLGCQHIVILGR